ncbi:MAG: DNA-directed RNA polymerase subunit RpoH/Rpb5 C-terminal domain-containing protein, partial [Nitrososphaera sp.]
MSDKKATAIKISNHIYQPKHEIILKSEAEEIMRKYNARPSQLPYIMTSDKAI